MPGRDQRFSQEYSWRLAFSSYAVDLELHREALTTHPLQLGPPRACKNCMIICSSTFIKMFSWGWSLVVFGAGQKVPSLWKLPILWNFFSVKTWNLRLVTIQSNTFSVFIQRSGAVQGLEKWCVALTCVGNGYLGVRGAFEGETPSMDHLPGTYIAGAMPWAVWKQKQPEC